MSGDKVEVDVGDLKALRRDVHCFVGDSQAAARLIACIPKRTVITETGFNGARAGVGLPGYLGYLTPSRAEAIFQNVLEAGGTLPEGWTEEVDG